MKALFLALTLFIFFSCTKEGMDGRETERKQLDDMKNDIKDRIGKVEWRDPKDWEIMELGSKACGGPQEYLAYPKELDQEGVDKLIQEYTEKEEEYNKKFGIVSDCKAIPKPTGITCEKGKPKLLMPSGG